VTARGCTCPAQARDRFDELEEKVARLSPLPMSSTGPFDDRVVDVPGSGEPPD
jgi:hypothetical protein